jgi:hypothetical protein
MVGLKKFINLILVLKNFVYFLISELEKEEINTSNNNE